jgi:bacterioferritin
MDNKKICDALNQARARELAVSVQYMRQHYMAAGLASTPVADIFKDIAKTEMGHAEELGERITYLGGTATTKPDPIKTATNLKQMLKDDLGAENEAVAMYRDIVKLCRDEGDSTSRRMMERLLADEEEHVDQFQKLLAK